MAPDTPSRFKSRFSILSLLPARHPPLHVTHPMPPTHHVARHHTVTVVSGAGVSPVHSEYPDPSTPLPFRRSVSAGVGAKKNGKDVLKDRKNEQGRSGESEYPPGAGLNGNCNSAKTHRPPPLNLEKTKRMYPSTSHDIIIEPGTCKTDIALHSPHNFNRDAQALPPLPTKKEQANKDMDKDKKPKPTKPAKIVDDPFDFAEVEAGHRYPSWQGGKVGIRPGQVIPRDMIPSLHSASSSLSSSPRSKRHTQTLSRPRTRAGSLAVTPIPDHYESVLHNVLLTPTYLGASPSSMPARTPTSSTSPHSDFYSRNHSQSRSTKRRTLIDRAAETVVGAARSAARNSRWLPGKSILKPSAALDADQSLRAMKEREEQEMDRFRRKVRPVRLGASIYEDGDGQSRSGSSRAAGNGNGKVGWSNSIASSSSPVREMNNTYTRRSPGWIGAREYDAGFEGQRARMPTRGDKGWRGTKEEEERLKRKQRIWKLGIVLAILILAALIIGLCTTLLRKDNKDSSSKSSSSDLSDSSTPSGTNSASKSSPTSSTSSQTLSTCLNLFTSSAPNSPSSFPCSDCVPLLVSTDNDFAHELSNGNSTGVGSALQFCALMDMSKSTPSANGAGLEGWSKDASPCGGWEGITCDSRGRVTGVKLQYPHVPDELSDTLGNIYALEEVHILGNSSVPAGSFPTSLLSLPDLKTIDFEYTALSGPIDTAPFSSAANLNALILVNNANLGKKMPDLSQNSKLATLAVTGQGLEDARADKLPSSINYLDLSFNSLSGDVPTFSSLTSLSTLYLQSNKYDSSPSSLPASLTSLSMTSNPSLSGEMPANVCGSLILSLCDLRGTKLSGSSQLATLPIPVPDPSSSAASIGGSSESSSTATSASASSFSASSMSASSTLEETSSTGGSTSTNTNTASMAAAPMVSIVGREPSPGQITCGVCKFV